MDFFDRVRLAVKSQNTTIEDFLTNLFGSKISRSTYNTWRRRRVLPRADIAVTIAKALGTTVEYLVTGETNEIKYFPNPSGNKAEILEDLNLLDEKNVSALQLIIKQMVKTTVKQDTHLMDGFVAEGS